MPFLDEFNVDEGKTPPSILFEKLLQANTIHDMALILEERGKNVVTKVLSNVKMVGFSKGSVIILLIRSRIMNPNVNDVLD